jgi:acetyl esterase/lipase
MSRAFGSIHRRAAWGIGPLLVITSLLPAQSTIRLSTSVPSPSTQPSLPEELIPAERIGPQLKQFGAWLFNVSQPSLVVYRSDPAKSNGTAVIICPGGGFHFLAMETEGEPLARWFNDRGVTAFLLKYRVLQTTPEHRARLFASSMTSHVDSEISAILPLAAADARSALDYVRAHAVEFGVVPTRVGMLGASAGATLLMSLVLSPSNGREPDFLALLYTVVFDSMRPLHVPKSAPPLFIAVASDDQLGLASANTEVYDAWIAAGRSAELHAYANGGHGFGMLRQGLPVDRWTVLLEDWLRLQGLLTPPK